MKAQSKPAQGARYEGNEKRAAARTVALPSMLIEELARIVFGRRRNCFAWAYATPDDCFVVVQEDGSPLQPNSLTHAFVRLLAKASEIAAGPLPRSEALARNTYARERRPSEGRAGTVWAQQCRDYARPLQPCAAGNAGRRRREG